MATLLSTAAVEGLGTMPRHNSKQSYDGLYFPRDGSGVGHLVIAGGDSVLKLVSRKPWMKAREENTDFHGSLDDGTKVSLLNCIQTASKDYGFGEGAQYEINLFPHYILVGEAFISSSDIVIQSLHYHFENIHCLVRGHRIFGTVSPEREEFRQVLESDHQRREDSARENGWDVPEFEPEIGDHPLLLYYSGLSTIAKCNSELGSVSLTHRPSHGWGSSKGVGVDNEISVDLEFACPQNMDDAIKSLWKLHGFFELCLGRRQRYLWIEAEIANGKPDGAGEPTPRFELLWSLCNDRVTGETKSTSYGDILLHPDTRRTEFTEVLSKWLNSEKRMGEARNRWAAAFHSGGYGIDRIVGAANMFDLLPEESVPKKVEIEKQVQDALDDSRALFKALPDSLVRQSVLSALGRVGTASLRDKIFHRANVVIQKIPDMFSELHVPCNQAVLCRNHYVHGSPAAFDYLEEFGSFAFITDTLEFVFAISDLIELGWDYESWSSKGTSMTHSFGSYARNYQEGLKQLKALL